MCRSWGLSASRSSRSIVRWFEKNVLRESINTLARRGKPVYLFFDEVQNLKSWASELKSLVDHTAARTLVTGSSSLRIARGEASLAGRVSFIDLGPLRLREIAGVRHLGDLESISKRLCRAQAMDSAEPQ
jgi:predicted AAA+ superfamily ATPase